MFSTVFDLFVCTPNRDRFKYFGRIDDYIMLEHLNNKITPRYVCFFEVSRLLRWEPILWGSIGCLLAREMFCNWSEHISLVPSFYLSVPCFPSVFLMKILLLVLKNKKNTPVLCCFSESK